MVQRLELLTWNHRLVAKSIARNRYQLTHSLTHSLTHAYSLTHSCLLTHSLKVAEQLKAANVKISALSNEQEVIRETLQKEKEDMMKEMNILLKVGNALTHALTHSLTHS